MKKRDTEHPGSGAALDAGGVRDPQKLFIANLDLIRRVVRHVAGRWLLGRQDVEDLEAEVHLKLIADDYAALHAQLPVRPPRRTVDPGMLDGTPAPGGQADAGLVESERRSSAERAHALLADALGLLSPEDRLLIRLAFCDGMTMASIAVTLGVRQRPLYRTKERCLETMRRPLLSRGLDARAVADLLACPGAPVETAGLSIREVESSQSGPSHPEGTGTKETDEN